MRAADGCLVHRPARRGQARRRADGAAPVERHRPDHADRGHGVRPGSRGRGHRPDPALPRGPDAPGHPGARPRGGPVGADGAGRDQLPAGHRSRVHVGPGPGGAGGGRHRAPGPRRRRSPRALAGPRHRPRPAVGPARGDLWGRPRAGEPDGCRLRARRAEPGCRLLRQALPRPRLDPGRPEPRAGRARAATAA